jgi:hypothetical protein
LWILGANYAHLIKELFWMVVSSVIGVFNNVSLSMNTSKGWVKDSWKGIPLTLGVQVLIIPLLDLSTVQGVIFFGIFTKIPGLLVNFYMNYQGLSEKYTQTV